MRRRVKTSEEDGNRVWINTIVLIKFTISLLHHSLKHVYLLLVVKFQIFNLLLLSLYIVHALSLPLFLSLSLSFQLLPESLILSLHPVHEISHFIKLSFLFNEFLLQSHLIRLLRLALIFQSLSCHVKLLLVYLQQLVLLLQLCFIMEVIL